MSLHLTVPDSSDSPSVALVWRVAVRMWAALSILLLTVSAGPVQCDEEVERFFETQIRPLLSEHCVQCHGPDEQSARLRLDTHANLLKGGESGPVIVPGKPVDSRLIAAVRRSDDLAMPPEEELTPQQVRALVHWVEMGAPWPEKSVPLETPAAEVARSHWAFQPVRDVEPPASDDAEVPLNPIDAFVRHRLREHELPLSPSADPRTLIRRVTYGLTGLPPTPDDVNRFVNDPRDAAWKQQIDKLLSEPAYGEHWSRLWLDVARYSDTKGYVYARENRHWVHAWSYRDWVIRAFNEDIPYDRFLLLQLAADQIPDRDPDDLAAMGFLTIGRRFLGVTRDIMDDRIDAITRGTMGLTVACARCHDHKYDPIPTEDYYSLYGVLHSCEEQRIELPAKSVPTDEWKKELAARQQKFQDRYDSERLIASERCRDKVADYLRIQMDLDTVPAQGFDQVLLPDDVIPEFARRWDEFLRAAKRTREPVFQHWHAFAELSAEQFSRDAVGVIANLNARPNEDVNPRIAAAFAQPPADFAEVVDRYATVFAGIRDEWRQVTEAANANGREAPAAMSVPADEQLRQVLYGSLSPCEVSSERLVHTEYLFTTDICRQLWELQKEIDTWINSAPHEPRYALTLADRSVPSEPRVFRRGNPKTPGDDVPRRFLSVLSDESDAPFETGSGRLELAQSIVDPANPLTARVIVNRVWARHFGRGLVATPSDFGVRSGLPTHPDLLDWLARNFIQHGWSLKHLHRLILTSATYRQTSRDPVDAEVLERVRREDPSNRLLWKMPLHRLTFEEFRDSMFTVSEELDRRRGGRPEPLFGESPSQRRTIYGEIDRQFFPAALRVFDVANPDIHIPQRSETTVPQQALFYMNHPLVQDRARKLAELTSSQGSSEDRVQRLFERVLQRSAHDEEIRTALALVRQAQLTTAAPVPATVQDWSYCYGKYDEEKAAVVDVTVIPHFTGSAWQGGPAWPDAKLGWVQLTATGGHPGNDREHAAVRRWTAPRDAVISIMSTFVHEPEPGDGVRAFVVSSRSGKLANASIHHKTVELNADAVFVRAGDTIDFAVDIGNVLNSDQFLWNVTITASDGESGDPAADTVWNSKADFTGDPAIPLQPWEQLAQVLLCCNEFLFVD